MNNMALKIAAVAVGLACATATPTLAGDYKGGSMKDGGFVDQPTWIATYTGADFAKDSFYTYSGAVVSLQRDLSRSGFVFQGFAGYGSYEYDSASVPGGKVDGDVSQLAAMLGYLWVRPGAAVGLRGPARLLVDLPGGHLRPRRAPEGALVDDAAARTLGAGRARRAAARAGRRGHDRGLRRRGRSSSEPRAGSRSTPPRRCCP